MHDGWLNCIKPNGAFISMHGYPVKIIGFKFAVEIKIRCLKIYESVFDDMVVDAGL